MARVCDEQQMGDVRATVDVVARLLNDAHVNNEQISAAEAIQRVEATVTRKIAVGIERSKVEDVW